MKLYIIAGEESGDFIGSKIIQALKKNHSRLVIDGIGGNKMREAGLCSLFPIQNINLMGFIEILPHIFRIKKLINQTIEDIKNKQPQILVTIDSPGFTMRVAKAIKQIMPEVKLIHIVAPSVWAYKAGRAKKYAAIYDHLLTLLPFEPPYFTKENLATNYIGHPIIEQKFYTNTTKLRQEFGFNDKQKIITITPGSREAEIKRHMPIITKAMNQLAKLHDLQVLFIQPNDSHFAVIKKHLTNAEFTYSIFCDPAKKLKLFAISNIALAKSGTNTLEIAASNTPMVIGYKVNFLSYLLIKTMIKIKYVCLINIIPNKMIIPELLQYNFNAERIAHSLHELLQSKQKRDAQIKEANNVLLQLGLKQHPLPSNIAASVIGKYLSAGSRL